MRLFVGLALPDEVRDDLSRIAGGLSGARWVDPESLHLTLRFVGEVDRGAAEDLDASLTGVDAPAFDMAFDGLGTFGNDRKQRALWAAVPPNPALEHLRAKVESAVVRAGFEPERRKFKPHVTLARLHGVAPDRLGAYLAHNGAFGTEAFTVDSFVLFRSHLGDEGARYEALADYPLQNFSMVGSDAD